MPVTQTFQPPHNGPRNVGLRARGCSHAVTLVPMNQYKAILFDLDGTLVDHDSAAHQAAHDWAVELGVEPDVQRWIDIETRWFKRFEEGKCTHPQQRVERIREYLDKPELPEEKCRDLFAVFLKHYESNWRAYDDAAAALDAAHRAGAVVGILTNGAEELQMKKMNRTGLWKDHMIMLAAAELGAAKPQKECYERALAKINEHSETTISPDEVLLIGDHPGNDVEGAIAVGWNAVLLDRNGEHTEKNYRVITTLEQLL